ncbi:barstar family protein [Streptomyces sp. NPDC002533]
MHQGNQSYTVTTRVSYNRKSGYAVETSLKRGPKPQKTRKITTWIGGGITHTTTVPDNRPPLETWQKIVLGVVVGASAAVILAPAAMAIGTEAAAACLINPAGCAVTVSEVATGGAAGGSLGSVPARPFFRVEIDGERITSAKEFHEALAGALDFGPYYRPNLPALWDRLSTDIERPVELIWRNSEASKAAMGASEFDDLRDLLLRVQAQDEDFGFSDRFTVRFE